MNFFSALNIFLSILAAVGNALILNALNNVSSVHPPTKLFFRCLAVTDLFVGLFVQPLYATYIMSRVIKINAGKRYGPQGSLFSLNTLPGNFDFLLHEDPSQAATSTSPSTKQCSPQTAERTMDSTKHSKIQKDSFQHYVGSVGISCLLCSVGHHGCAVCQITKTFSGLESFIQSSLLKFISKPDLVLLENRGSQTSG